MEREILNHLIAWKNKKNRKPLVLMGARQVGKTWIMKEFGKKCFEQTVYINFENNSRLKNIFEDDFDPRLMYYNLIISNPNFTSRNISIEGKYVGTVPAGDVAVFKVRRKYYGDILSEQTSGYLFFPTIERRRINRRPSANETIKIVL